MNVIRPLLLLRAYRSDMRHCVPVGSVHAHHLAPPALRGGGGRILRSYGERGKSTRCTFSSAPSHADMSALHALFLHSSPEDWAIALL